MKKLKLNADDLQVEEFQLQPDVAVTRGTVRGLATADETAPCYYCFIVLETHTCYC